MEKTKSTLQQIYKPNRFETIYNNSNNNNNNNNKNQSNKQYEVII